MAAHAHMLSFSPQHVFTDILNQVPATAKEELAKLRPEPNSTPEVAATAFSKQLEYLREHQEDLYRPDRVS
eukprot:3051240-Alexandrium_andersonii.AAC.1